MIDIDINITVIMNRSIKYVLLLLINALFYMIFTSEVLLTGWLPHKPRRVLNYHVESSPASTSTSTVSLPPVEDTIGRKELKGILFHGQVKFSAINREFEIFI